MATDQGGATHVYEVEHFGGGLIPDLNGRKQYANARGFANSRGGDSHSARQPAAYDWPRERWHLFSAASIQDGES